LCVDQYRAYSSLLRPLFFCNDDSLCVRLLQLILFTMDLGATKRCFAPRLLNLCVCFLFVMQAPTQSHFEPFLQQDQKMTSTEGATMFRPKSMKSVKEVASLQFLALYAAEYDDGGVTRSWDVARRVHSRQQQHQHSDGLLSSQQATNVDDAVEVDLPIDGVDVVVILETRPVPQIVVVLQYRPPVDAFSLEFPAGLVDPCESPIQAALRELHEETGYMATPEDCEDVSDDILAYEPGMTNSCFKLVVVHVNMEKAENQNPVQKLDSGEDIAVFKIPHNGDMLKALSELRTQTEREQVGKRCVIDGKLFTYAAGLRAASLAQARRPSATII
jgi:ADP-ribose pyrophosphatase